MSAATKPAGVNKLTHAQARKEVENLRREIGVLQEKKSAIQAEIEAIREGRKEEMRKAKVEADQIIASRNFVSSQVNAQTEEIAKVHAELAMFTEPIGDVPSWKDIATGAILIVRLLKENRLPMEINFPIRRVVDFLVVLARSQWLCKLLAKLMRMSKCDARGSHRMNEDLEYCHDCGASVTDIARSKAILAQEKRDQITGAVMGSASPLRWAAPAFSRFANMASIPASPVGAIGTANFGTIKTIKKIQSSDVNIQVDITAKK